MSRKRELGLALLFGIASLAVAAPSAAAPARRSSTKDLLAQRDRVAQASVTIPAKMCAGSVVGERTRVLTAAHCIPEGSDRLAVKLRDGELVDSTLEYLDRDADMALLRLDHPAPVTPLALSQKAPAAGDSVLFVGRIDRRSRAQVASVERVGRCPSLPGVPTALFTTLKARPGDSGAPVLDRNLRVVAVVHGGASCEIAAPTLDLAKQIAAGTLPALPAPATPSPATPSPTTPDAAADPTADVYKFGPAVFERTPSGFKFRWSFRWQGRL
jgi:S1-C subfamily serine protease